MAVGNRPGELAAVWSILVKTTEEAAALALSEMNTRPAPVATQRVPTSVAAVERAMNATAPPARVPPYVAELLRLVRPGGPMRTKSPHAVLAAEVVNSGQLASRKAWLPAQSWVRQTLYEPWKMVPPFAELGSAMIGG